MDQQRFNTLLTLPFVILFTVLAGWVTSQLIDIIAPHLSTSDRMIFVGGMMIFVCISMIWYSTSRIKHKRRR